MTTAVLCVQNMSVPDDPRVWNEATTLAAAGYDVTVVAPSAPGRPRAERLDGVDVVRYRAPRERGGIAGQLLEVVAGFAGTALTVRRVRRAGPIAVLHVANPPDTLFPLAWLARRRGTKFVFDQHDVAPELLAAKMGRRPVLERVLRQLERRSYRVADVVVVANNTTRAIALGRSGKRPEHVVTIRLGPRDVHPATGPPPDVPVVAYAGVMGVQDSVDLLVEAFAALRRADDRLVRLLLIGRGDAVPHLRQLVRERGIEDAVTWPGWLSREEMHRQLAGATVAVSPDVDNPYTRTCTMIKVSEYLSLGIPAVVADLPENRATAGDAAAYFRPGDADDLASRLAEVVHDPQRRGDLAAAARRRAPSLRWEHSAGRLLATYRHLLDGAPPVPGEQHVPVRATTADASL